MESSQPLAPQAAKGSTSETIALFPASAKIAELTGDHANLLSAEAPASGLGFDVVPGSPAGRDAELLTALAAEKSRQETGPTNPKALVRELAGEYAEEKGIILSERQLKKLDRMGARLEKKSRRYEDVNWAPENNLEIFILAAAAVGLVVGIFSGAGWFVFVLAALAYLYLKLLHNK